MIITYKLMEIIMTVDAIILAQVVRELRQRTVTAKIEKVHQPTKDELAFILHTKDGKKRLVLSADASDARIHITSTSKENPQTAPNFCMLLRKHIAGGRITAVEQHGLERIVKLSVAARDEMGHETSYSVICEIMGKHSNVILVNAEGKILDALKRVNPEQSRVRQVLPGMKYTLPPCEKLSPLTASVTTISELICQPIELSIISNLAGMNRVCVNEILYRRPVSELTQNRKDSLAEQIKNLVTQAMENPMPCVYFDGDKPVAFTPLKYASFEGYRCAIFPDANSALDRYYTCKETYARVKQKRDSLLRLVNKHTSRVAKKLKYQLETLKEADGAEQYRINGELITANLYRIDRGTKQIEADNYYTGEKQAITLDTTITPAANAQRCFKKYNKLNNARKIAVKLAHDYEQEISLLENAAYNLSIAKSLEELEELRQELAKFGYVELGKAEKPRVSDPLAKPLSFVSSDGFKIFAGRNSRQNDALTMKVAAATDLWFHARNIPGSHILLITEGKEVPDNTLVEAAVIAAYYSSAKTGGKADIDYCLRKNVWKANGAKPGLVYYEHHNSISVPIDEALVEKLRAGEE